MSESTPLHPVLAPAYIPKPSIYNAALVGLQAGGVGVLVSTVQNALGQHTHGASGFVTRTGGTIGFFAAMGATFALTEAVVANTRETDDALNGAAGGCAAGFLAGIRARSIPMAVGSCALIGGLVGTFDAAGKHMSGDGRYRESREQREERRRRFFKQKPAQEGAEEAE